jgi:hypothetical protein
MECIMDEKLIKILNENIKRYQVQGNSRGVEANEGRK